MYAYRRVAPAMTQTTIVGGLGLSVFALSTFTPTQRFGTLMLTILTSGILGELIFLPALLASPLGKLFMPYPDKGNDGEKAQTESPGELPPTSEPEAEIKSKETIVDSDNLDTSLSKQRVDSGHGVQLHNHLQPKPGRISRVDSRHSTDSD
jgi:hypothetical protein